MSKSEKQTLVVLKGEGANLHELEATTIVYDKKKTPLSKILVGEGGVLKHVTPAGDIAEHHAIPMEKGVHHVGRQVEYNPFDSSIGQVFD